MQQSEYKVNKKLEKFTSYLDFLYNWLLPEALIYGMSPDQFWYDEPQLFFSYARQYERKQERQIEYDNYMAWISWMYGLKAIQQGLASKPNAKIYPKKPFELGKKDDDDEFTLKDKMAIRKQNAKAMVERFKERK